MNRKGYQKNESCSENHFWIAIWVLFLHFCDSMHKTNIFKQAKFQIEQTTFNHNSNHGFIYWALNILLITFDM